jgi:hypothetical protein
VRVSKNSIRCRCKRSDSTQTTSMYAYLEIGGRQSEKYSGGTGNQFLRYVEVVPKCVRYSTVLTSGVCLAMLQGDRHPQLALTHVALPCTQLPTCQASSATCQALAAKSGPSTAVAHDVDCEAEASHSLAR